MALFSNKKNKEDKEVEKKDVKAAKVVKTVKKVKEVKKTKTSSPDSSTSSMKDLYAEKEEKKGKTKTKNTSKRPGSKTLSSRVLVKPLITEKTTNLVEQGKYAFIVALNANKIEVAKAVSDIYGVDVIAVNVIRMQGKKVSRAKVRGKRSDFKKAIVSLKKGQSIELYEGV